MGRDEAGSPSKVEDVAGTAENGKKFRGTFTSRAGKTAGQLASILNAILQFVPTDGVR